MFFVIYKTLNLKTKYNLNSYRDFLKLLEKKYPFFNNKLFLIIINTFLAISFYIMIIGLATLFNYQFGIAKFLIVSIVIFICYIIFNKNNITFICTINTLLMPILIFFIILLSINNINFSEINLNENNNLLFSVLYGLLYFSYNSLLIIPILFNLPIKNKKNSFILSFIFSFIIFLLTLFLDLLLLTFFNNIKNIDLPILAICNFSDSFYSFFYFFIILSAILTTLFSSGYSFVNNISENNKKIYLILFLLLSFVFTYISFSNLINTFYPIFGLLGLIQIFLILINKY